MGHEANDFEPHRTIAPCVDSLVTCQLKQTVVRKSCAVLLCSVPTSFRANLNLLPIPSRDTEILVCESSKLVFRRLYTASRRLPPTDQRPYPPSRPSRRNPPPARPPPTDQQPSAVSFQTHSSSSASQPAHGKATSRCHLRVSTASSSVCVCACVRARSNRTLRGIAMCARTLFASSTVFNPRLTL